VLWLKMAESIKIFRIPILPPSWILSSGIIDPTVARRDILRAVNGGLLVLKKASPEWIP